MKKMVKNKSKGFFSRLFAFKTNSNCCNVQFEEITKDKNLTKKESEESLKKRKSENN